MNDLISRQAAIDAITEIDDGDNVDIFTGEVKELLGDLPSVEPIRMTKDEIIDYLYKINVHADIKIEDIAEDLSR